MASFDYDLGIIGGGAAGLTAAAGSAQFGAKTILIEKSSKLGGDCLHYGCVPSKTLIRTAAVWNLAGRSNAFGLPTITLPPVDLGAVMDRVQQVIEKIQHLDSTERFCGLGAEIRFGSPTFSDDHVVELDGKRIAAKNWIIATGSSPVVPPIEGLAAVPYWTNETVFSQRTLPGRLIVLGGGPIAGDLWERHPRRRQDGAVRRRQPGQRGCLPQRLHAAGVRRQPARYVRGVRPRDGELERPERAVPDQLPAPALW